MTAPTTFADFYALGYKRLVPVIPPSAPISETSSLFKRVGTPQDGRGKTPGVRGKDGNWHSFDWTKYEADELDCQRWQNMAAGIGVKMGQGLYFIDADTMDKALAGIIQMGVTKHFGVLCCRIGNWPKAGYLIRVSEAIKYMRVEFGDERLEILGEGRFAVFAGTHPKTLKPYTWPFPLLPFDQIPVVTAQQMVNFLEDMRLQLPKACPKIITEGSTNDVSQASLKGSLDTVRKAVAATPNTSAAFATREAYRDYGYAIKAALPDNEPEAFEIFAEWCARWTDGENNPDVVAADWRRMKPPYRRGASWLYETAEQHAPEQFKKVDVYFDVIPVEESLFAAEATHSEAKTDTFPILGIGEIISRPPPVYLVARHIPEIGVGFLYSTPGAGKTFLALDITLHIAYGRSAWHGDEIRAPNDTVVVYIAAEGSYGLRNRILGWLKKHDIKEHSDRLVVIEQTVRFMDREDIDKLLRTVTSAVRRRPVLVVVDTVSRAIPGAEENGQQDMSMFVSACDRLRDAFKCAVLGIHHESKDGKGMRGSSVLNGAGDFVFRLDRNPKKSTGHLHCEKQKDAPDGWSEPYRFDGVNLGDGQSSLVIERGKVVTLGAQQTEMGGVPFVPNTGSALDDALLSAVQDASEEGVQLSPAHNSPHYAPKVLRRRSRDLEAWLMRDVEDGWNRAVKAGRVVASHAGRTASRHTAVTYVLVRSSIETKPQSMFD